MRPSLCVNCVFISLFYPPQWVQRWVEQSGSASHHRCPPRAPSPASWHTCRGPWWESAWGCSSCAATRRVCRSSAPGGSSSFPSSPSSSLPYFGTSLRTSSWGCRSHLLPDEGPPAGPPPHTHWLQPCSKQKISPVTTVNSSPLKLDPNEMIWSHSKIKSTKNSFLQILCKSKKYISFIKEGLQ